MNKCLNCEIETNNRKFCSISCQNKYQNSEKADIKFGLFKEFIVKCEKCNKDFIVKEREKMFPKKKKYFCSRKCANSRIFSDETKNKIRKSLILKIKDKKFKTFVCKKCNKNFNSNKKNRIFCSKSCSMSLKNDLGVGKKAGLASVKKQSENKRSKNEIYFSELCKQNFKNVLTNESIFNGWDADIIIEDIKTAVLWNGKWHYEKIKKEHSVEQVQNRDKIKIKEIEKKNYKVYVIKDMGKFNKKFVEEVFENFITQFS